MRALLVDDEKLLLDTLEWAVGKSPDVTEVYAFQNELEALECAKSTKIDVAFLDISLHSMNGIELAEKLTEINPDLPIVFCTGFTEYAIDAFAIHATGFLTKPISYEDIQREIDFIKGRNKRKPLLYARCFGTFDISSGTKAHIRFDRSKTKELLAYLIDRRGAVVTSKEICATLWPDDFDDKKNMNYVRQLILDLRKGLKKAGAEKVLLSFQHGYCIDTSLVDCDYYQFLDGDISAIHQFTGEYMDSYSWAEYTCAYLASKIEG